MSTESAPYGENPHPPADPATKGCGSGCLWLVGTFAALMVIGVIVGLVGGGGDDEPSEPTAFEAELQCQEWVRAKLKAPSTAKFSETSSRGGPVSWTVQGYVDAENSFGAMLRSSWTCSIRIDGDMWRGSTQVSQ